MSPPPVPGRPPGPFEPPCSGGPTPKISASSEFVSHLNRSPEVSGNPILPASLIAQGSGHRRPELKVPLVSSSSDASPVQISCHLESICPSKSAFESTRSLFIANSMVQSPIPAISGPVCSIQPSICAPLSLGMSFPPLISSLRPPIGDALFCNSLPSSANIPSELATFPTESHLISTGSSLLAPSPNLGGGPLAGQRVDPVESKGQPGRVNSALDSARFVVPGVPVGDHECPVPPIVSFRDILGRDASSRSPLVFTDDGLRSESSSSTGEVPVQSVRDGIPGILFPDQLISSLSARFKFALVGRVSGNRRLTPNSVILSALSCIGLLGSHTVQFLPRGYLVLILSCEADYLRFWTQPEVSIRSVVIRFSKWTPEFTLEADSSIAPVWVRFPDLPLHLYDRQSLFHIAQLLGHPVQVDQFTADGSKGSFARVCVELDVLAPRPEKIWVGWGSHVVHLDVVYERVPFYCSECLMLGHSSQRCVRSAAARAKAQGKRPVSSPSAAPSPAVSQSDVPCGSASVPIEPGWSRQRRRRRLLRHQVPASSSPLGNPFEIHDASVEDVPSDFELDPDPSCPVSSVPISTIGLSRGSIVEASPIQVDVVPVVSVVAPLVFSSPPSLFEVGSGSGEHLSASVLTSSSPVMSLPLPGRTRSQRRRFYRAQAAQLGSPYGRPPDPG